MSQSTQGHTVRSYDQELKELHGLVSTMAEQVQKQIARAVKSLEDEAPEDARAMINDDREINALDVQIDEGIIRLIAKRQPMAKDLREILTVGKIVTDLERIGDQARRIARLTIHFYDNDQPPPNYHLLQDIFRMSGFVQDLLDRAMRSFEALNLDQAIEVIRLDSTLEEDYKSALRRISTFVLEDARNVGHMIDVALALRAVERMGGHAKNIAGYVIFLATGRDVRHESLEAIVAQIESA